MCITQLTAPEACALLGYFIPLTVLRLATNSKHISCGARKQNITNISVSFSLFFKSANAPKNLGCRPCIGSIQI